MTEEAARPITPLPPYSFTYWGLAEELNSDVEINILHTGEGTIWTGLEGANMGNMGGRGCCETRNRPCR